MADRSRLEELLRQAELDLAELENQVAAGELDEPTAEKLRDVYRRERRRVGAALEVARTEPPPAVGRSRQRVIAGFVVFAVAVAGIVAAVTFALEDRPPGGFATGGIATDVLRGGGPDLASVTNEELEAVVAANPGVVPMRLALARRYVDAGEFSRALEHYFTVLEDGPNAEALSYVGWMTYLSNEAELGAQYLDRALQVVPDYPLALWFLANVRYDAFDDGPGAVNLLDRLLVAEGLPPELRTAAEELRAAAAS